MVLQFITRREMTRNKKAEVLLLPADLQFTNGNAQDSYMLYFLFNGHI